MLRQAITTAFIFAASPFLLAQTSPPAAQGAGVQAEAADWQRMHQLGLEHKTAWDLYQALKKQAGGGKVSPPFSQLPDWSGLWEHGRGGREVSYIGPGPGGVMAKLTPKALAEVQAQKARVAKGILYQENISDCGPPGYPMWLDIPFMREFVVRPEETWLSSETVNNVRRIYTDGRDHLPEDARYPLYYGDSIGFWDGQKLVIHTNQLMARSMGGAGIQQSEQMEGVEIWEKVAPNTVEAKIWLYDPTVYLEPWYVARHYTKIPNPRNELRVNYWNCLENPNNAVYKTEDGNTARKGYTFIKPDDKSAAQPKK